MSSEIANQDQLTVSDKVTQVFSIARVTFQEIIRDKVLLNIVLFSIILLGIAYAASLLTFITPERVVIDFGFAAMNISCAMIAIFHGAGMISKEFERRTVFVALARPISRFQFLLGKYFGLIAVLTLNGLLIAGALSILYISLGGGITVTFFVGIQFLILQSYYVAALTMIFACFSTASETVIIMIGFYLIGNNITEVENLLDKLNAGVLKSALQLGVVSLPNLEHFNQGFNITYSLPIPVEVIFKTVSYAILMIGAALYLSGILIERKEG
jgi:ABC-type transport system involved in multi-copper enzyme maturation permease subunit